MNISFINSNDYFQLNSEKYPASYTWLLNLKNVIISSKYSILDNQFWLSKQAARTTKFAASLKDKYETIYTRELSTLAL